MNDRTNHQTRTRQRVECSNSQDVCDQGRVRGSRLLLGELGCLLLAVLLLLGLGAGQAVAQERTHQISWGHPNPNEVSRFVVLVSPVEGTVAATREINVGKPSAQSMGSLQLFSAFISFGTDEYLAVAAVGHDGQRSTPSNWTGMPPTRPGQPLLVGP